jgi:hypothetical protein
VASLANSCSGDSGMICINDNPQIQGTQNTVDAQMNSQVYNSARPPRPVTSQDLVHVIWYDNTPGNPDILYRKSSEVFA